MAQGSDAGILWILANAWHEQQTETHFISHICLSTPSVIHLRLEQDLHKYCVAPFDAMKTKHTYLRNQKTDKFNSRFRKILQLNKKVPQRIAMNTIQRIAPFFVGRILANLSTGDHRPRLAVSQTLVRHKLEQLATSPILPPTTPAIIVMARRVTLTGKTTSSNGCWAS